MRVHAPIALVILCASLVGSAGFWAGVASAPAAGNNPGTVVAGGNGRGSALTQLARPEQITFDDRDQLFVADVFNNRTVQWSGSPGRATVVAGGALGGLGSYPSGVAVDAAGRVFVADTFNHRIVRWDPGAVSGVVVAGGPGTGDANSGIDLSRLNNPSQLVATPDGAVIVADTGNDRVVRWPDGADTGVLVAGGQGRGQSLGQLALPVGVALSPTGDVYVADTQNHRVVRWGPLGGQGVLVAGGTGPGAGAAQLSGPTGIVLDAGGTIFVADTQNHRVMRWAAGASAGVVVAGGRGPGAALDQLSKPVGVLLDGVGGLLIGDRENDRVLRVGASGANAVPVEPPVTTTPIPAGGATFSPPAAYVPPVLTDVALDPEVLAALLRANGGVAVPVTPTPTPPTLAAASVVPGAVNGVLGTPATGFPTTEAGPEPTWSRPLAAPREPSRLPVTGTEVLQLVVFGGALVAGGVFVIRRWRGRRADLPGRRA